MLAKIYQYLKTSHENDKTELIYRAKMRIHNATKNPKGWILIDALIGMVILSVALMALAAVYGQAVKTTAADKNYNYAVYLAQQTLEDLKTQDGTAAIILPADSDVTRDNNMTFHVKTRTISVSETLNAKIVPVQVTVSWTEAGQLSKQVQMVSYYYHQ